MEETSSQTSPLLVFEKKVAASSLENNINAIKSFGQYNLVAQYVEKVKSRNYEELAKMIGLPDNEENFTLFHGTVPQKMQSIREKGIVGFKELQTERITVTPSPTVAMYHVIANGPHDTLRKAGSLSETYSQDKPVLLVIKIPKNYIHSQAEANTPAFDRESAEKYSISPEKNTTAHHFEYKLGLQAGSWKHGLDTATTGLQFPLNHIPPEYVFVRTEQGDIAIDSYASH